MVGVPSKIAASDDVGFQLGPAMLSGEAGLVKEINQLSLTWVPVETEATTRTEIVPCAS